MTAGDLRGEEVVIIEVTYGATVTVGQAVHIESDGKWDPVADADTGKFGVALDAGGDTETGRVVIWGRVEATNGSTTTSIKKGSAVMAGASGTVVTTDHGAIGENIGTAMEEIAASTAGTIWVGLVE